MAATTLLTSDQFLPLPEKFDQHGNWIKDELIGGKVVKVPPASIIHGLIKNRINELLIAYFGANPQLGFKSLVEIGMQVSDTDAFIPDVSVVLRDRLPGQTRVFHGAPEIAIEVVFPTDTAKHLKRKVKAYLEGGTQSVWIVFPEDRSVMIHTAGAVRELSSGESISDPLLSGFSSSVAAFFELT